jgi:hypothetical protein
MHMLMQQVEKQGGSEPYSQTIIPAAAAVMIPFPRSKAFLKAWNPIANHHQWRS